MKKKINKIINNPFVNASFYSAISSVIKILTSLLIGKIIAQMSGAEGMVLYGQLLSFVVILNVFSGGAILQGITKYVAEYNNQDKNKIPVLLSTALKISLYLSLFFGALMILFSKLISKLILYTEEYYLVFVVFGITISFFTINNFLLAILNGYKEYKKFNIINIILNISSLIITVVLSYFLDVLGTLLSVVVNQSIILSISIYFLRNENWLRKENFNLSINKTQLKLLLGFGIVAILSTALTPISSIIIRNNIISSVSLFDAGLYEFVFRISGAVIMFFTLTISTYYLPRISEINNKKELLLEVKKTYIIVIPVIFVLLLIVYFLRDFITIILASREFLVASNLFIYVLIGVFFKVITQIVGFVFLSKAKIKEVIIIEVLFNICFTIMSIFLVNRIGLVGAVMAFLICNILYFIGVLSLFLNTFVFKKSII